MTRFVPVNSAALDPMLLRTFQLPFPFPASHLSGIGKEVVVVLLEPAANCDDRLHLRLPASRG
jgi:hypothetical protein